MALNPPERYSDLNLNTRKTPLRLQREPLAADQGIPREPVRARDHKTIALLIAKRVHLVNTLHQRPQKLSHKINKTDVQITAAALKVLLGKTRVSNVSPFCQDLSRLAEEHRALAACCRKRPEAQKLEAKIIDQGERLGTLYGRRFNPEVLAEKTERASVAMDTLIQELHTLLVAELRQSASIQSDELTQRLEERAEVLRSVGERRGQNLYIQADRSAYDLKLALRDPVGNRENIYQMFVERSERERELLLRVFKERYGRDFLDVLENAYNGLLPKVKNLLRLPALRASLEERYGVDVGFFKALKKEFVPSVREFRAYCQRLKSFFDSLAHKVATPEISRIQAILENDKITASADSIFLAVWYNSKSSLGKISAILQTMSREETEAMERDFFQRYGKLVKQPLKELLADRFSGLRQRYLLARLQADDPRADAILFQMRLTESKHEFTALLIELSQATDNAGALLRRAYREEFKHDVSRETFPRKTSTAIVDWATHLLAGRHIQAAASRLRCATRGISGEWPGVIFYATTTDTAQAIIHSYNQQYQADFWAEFRHSRGHDREVIMRHYVEKGEIGEAELLRHCLVGFGHDVTGLKRCFEGKSKQEIDAHAEEYANRFSRLPVDPEHLSTLFTLDYAKLARETGNALRAGYYNAKSRGFLPALKTLPGDWVARVTQPRNLEEDLALELSGYKYHDIMHLRTGKPETPEDQIANFKKRFILEHTGKELNYAELQSSRVRRKRVSGKDQLRLDRAIHDEDILTLMTFYQRNDQPKSQFRVLLRLAQNQLSIHRDRQRRMVDLISNLVSATITAATGTCLAFLKIPVWHAMPIVGIASYESRYLIRVWLQGQGYGAEEDTLDKYLGAADGGTLTLAKWFKVARQLKFMRVARMPVSAGVKMAMKRTLSKHVHNKLATALLEEKVSGHARTLTEVDEEEMRGEVSAGSFGMENLLSIDRNLIEKCLSTKTLCRRIGREYLKA